eukprot:5429632-Heterocapsa_arctica.AAC.1
MGKTGGSKSLTGNQRTLRKEAANGYEAVLFKQVFQEASAPMVVTPGRPSALPLPKTAAPASSSADRAPPTGELVDYHAKFDEMST